MKWAQIVTKLEAQITICEKLKFPNVRDKQISIIVTAL
jgi:hypothetical protein